jgi:hypothetical protein
MSDMLNTETSEGETTTPAPETSQETTDEPTDEETGIETVGKMEDEEATNLYSWQAEVQQLMRAAGEIVVRVRRVTKQRDGATSHFDKQIEALEDQQNKLIDRMEELEGNAQTLLNDVKQRFGIEAGVDWRTVPDGRVQKIDPELLKAAREAAAATEK